MGIFVLFYISKWLKNIKKKIKNICFRYKSFVSLLCPLEPLSPGNAIGMRRSRLGQSIVKIILSCHLEMRQSVRTKDLCQQCGADTV